MLIRDSVAVSYSGGCLPPLLNYITKVVFIEGKIGHNLSLEEGSLSQKIQNTCKIRHFEVEKPIDRPIGRGFKPRSTYPVEK